VEVQLPPFAIRTHNFEDVSFTAIDLDVIVVTNLLKEAEAEFDNTCSH
jgi:hypothetical protein